MSRVRLVTLGSLLSLSVTFLPHASASIDITVPELPDLSSIIPGKYIVLLKDGETASVEDVLSEHQLLKDSIFEKIRGFSTGLSLDQVDLLKQDPRVELVEPDYTVQAFAQAIPSGINRADAELNTVAKINGKDERVDVDVAVIDTGVYARHKDLNVFKTVNFSSESSMDDRNGHGTHVAGTIGALDNTIGVVGIAPGARIWAVKVLDRRGSGSMSDIIEGVDYVTANAGEIEVANMSLGCECQSAALTTALNRSMAAGVVYVVAAGNSGKNASTFSPANHPDVITVSAIADFNGQPGGSARYTCYRDVDDTLADFSNFGNVVDIAAPGVCINSTWKGGRYSTISGTSMASPHVAGAVALYLSHTSKPTDLDGVTAVANAIKAAGTANGFTGDKDNTLEPLLNVANL